MENIVHYNKFNVALSYNATLNNFKSNSTVVDQLDGLKYLKGIFSNKNRFIERYVNPIKSILETHFSDIDKSDLQEKLSLLVQNFDSVEAFTYKEAFAIKDKMFMSIVFGSIDISEMINNLGSERIAVDGKNVNHKQFLNNGDFIGYKSYDNIYEVYRIDGRKLGVEIDLYALKCWCTTTNKEHWIWIDEKHKNDPLSAVASTFYVHENLIPYIKEIKRQGDVLLVELEEDVKPSGEKVPLTSDQYFSLLTAQS